MFSDYAWVWHVPDMTDPIRLFNLEGQVALVAGASRGIGNSIACGLSNAGAEVIGFGRSKPSEVNDNDYKYYQCDVTDTKNFTSQVKSIFNELKHIDILVNAAAITLQSKDGTDTTSVFQQTIETNLLAVFNCCNAVLPFMEAGEYGSIINISSIGASLGFPNNPGYVASKGGLSALTRALALDYGSKSIRVNTLVPGYIRTAMTEQSYSDVRKRTAREADNPVVKDPDELVSGNLSLLQ